GGGEGVPVVHLEVGRAAPVEFLPVVRRDAGLVVTLGAVEHAVGLAQHLVGRTVAVARARLGAHFRLRDQVDIGDATVRRAVADAGRVQAARGVVAALGQVFLRRRIRRDLAARAGIELAVVLDDDLGRRRRRLRRRAAAGGQQGGDPRDG